MAAPASQQRLPRLVSLASPAAQLKGSNLIAPLAGLLATRLDGAVGTRGRGQDLARREGHKAREQNRNKLQGGP